MKLTTIHTGNFKLDGGAMFGVVPKQIWNHLNPADENNLCNWAMRCLLVEVNDRKILIDTGIGNKQTDKFFAHYHLNGGFGLEKSLNEHHIQVDQITDVILTHLHFDHCGGAVSLVDGNLLPTFPNARYYVSETQWNHALNPNPREKASFLIENFKPLLESSQLVFVNEGDQIADVIDIYLVHGHTLGMITPLIHHPNGKKLFYAADLFPSSAHLKPNFAMAYDIQPLLTMSERHHYNELAMAESWWYFYEHDLDIEISQVSLNPKGQYEPVNQASLLEVFV